MEVEDGPPVVTHKHRGLIEVAKDAPVMYLPCLHELLPPFVALAIVGIVEEDLRDGSPFHSLLQRGREDRRGCRIVCGHKSRFKCSSPSSKSHLWLKDRQEEEPTTAEPGV